MFCKTSWIVSYVTTVRFGPLTSGARTAGENWRARQSLWMQNTGSENNLASNQRRGGQLPRSLAPPSLRQCRFCPYIASERFNLIRHERCHTGERPFKCSVCCCTFARQEYMKLHMRMHTGERPFRCNLCPNAFAWKTQLRRHMKKEH